MINFFIYPKITLNVDLLKLLYLYWAGLMQPAPIESPRVGTQQG